MQNHLERRSKNVADPIADFLFEYYAFRPGHLRRWSPGIGIELTGRQTTKFLGRPGYENTKDGVRLSNTTLPEKLVRATHWIRDVLVATQSSTPFYGCSGMHEWAMLYKTGLIRHESTPLRMSRAEINDVVEGRQLTCTHYDAFRFFADEAKPRNAMSLSRKEIRRQEQSGCLHTNMDLYKWAFKRYPWVSSELIADTFFFAYRIREIDMRASPYDLSAYDLAPIPVETAEGRRFYRSCQQAFSTEARTLRSRLIDSYDKMLPAP